VDLRVLAPETHDLMEREVKRAGALLEIQCDADVAPIEADPVELQQVLVNLVINAAEAMHEVQGARRIVMSIRNNSEGVYVSVADSGPGIPSEQMDRLFEPFFTTKASGMGMGLQICRNTVQAMGGTLAVRNREEGGAEFSFVLPFAASSASAV
jgi:C4-dicarboxylate-specific signal transduction histidine kinase